MVITVRGTDHNSNKAAHTAALLAGMNAVKYKKRTLVLQLSPKVSISDILIGNKKQLELNSGAFSYDESGIDSLMRSAEISGIRKEEFDTYCIPVIESTPNLLDVAKETSISNFEETLVQREDIFSAVIEQAKRIYDDVFLYVDGGKQELLEMVNRYTDKEVVCVRQGNKQDLSEVPEDSIFVISSYDENSSMSFKYIRKLYDVKRISYIPYNVQVKDAYNNGTLMSYIASNINLSDDDENYEVERSIDIILDQINNGIKEVKETTENFDDYIEKAQKEFGTALLPELEVVKEKKLFGREKETIRRIGDTSEKRIPELKEAAKPKLETKEEEIHEEEWNASEEKVTEEVPKKKNRLFSKSKESNSVKDEPKPKKGAPKATEASDSEEFEEPAPVIPEEVEEVFVNPEVLDEFAEEETATPEPPKPAKPRKTTAKKEEAEAPKAEPKEPPKAKKPAPVKMATKNKTIKCECGEELEPSFKFCPICGRKRPEGWICNCGHSNPERAKFCTECGEKKPD